MVRTIPAEDNFRLVAVSAFNISRGATYPSNVYLSGGVEIKTPVCLPVGQNGEPVCDGMMVLRADEAILHEDTGEIEAHGNVSVTPLYHEPRK
jgi:lipopolysaccharide assembly outer membrane protein LptD (OstA)